MLSRCSIDIHTKTNDVSNNGKGSSGQRAELYEMTTFNNLKQQLFLLFAVFRSVATETMSHGYVVTISIISAKETSTVHVSLFGVIEKTRNKSSCFNKKLIHWRS